MNNEGVDFHLRIHPVTAILIALALASAGFGVGRFTLPNFPFIGYASSPTPSNTPAPTADPWRETALVGTLKYTANTNKYYLLAQFSEAVYLDVRINVDLASFVGKRILATGKYNSKTHTLIVTDVLDLEVLPKTPNVIPTISPTPTSSPTNTPVDTTTPLGSTSTP